MTFIMRHSLRCMLMFLLSSCTHKPDVTLTLSGSIGESKNCKIIITKLGDPLEGYFLGSNDTSKKVLITGSLKGEQLIIKEKSKKEITKFGELSGKYDGGSYAGLWRNEKRERELPFYFTRVQEIDEKNSNNKGGKVAYTAFDKDKSFNFYHGLKAEVEGKTYILIKDQDLCFTIYDIRDFDNDGYNDVLLDNAEACGGNAAGNTCSFFSYNGKGNFRETEHLDYDSMSVEKYNGIWSLNLFYYGMRKSEDRVVLRNQEAVTIEHKESKRLKAIKEMLAEELSQIREKYIQYDLDGDGHSDKIHAEYWDRWNLLIWDVQFSNGMSFDTGRGVSRLGILASKTNGVNDLVTDLDDVWGWDGKRYKLK